MRVLVWVTSGRKTVHVHLPPGYFPGVPWPELEEFAELVAAEFPGTRRVLSFRSSWASYDGVERHGYVRIEGPCEEPDRCPA